MTTATAKTFEDGVREERTRIAAWLDTQRKDLPAHGWEFAAALRAENPETPSPDDVVRALNLMWAFASALVERHDMNGDDTLTDADHRAWQEASGAASAALREPKPQYGVVQSPVNGLWYMTRDGVVPAAADGVETPWDAQNLLPLSYPMPDWGFVRSAETIEFRPLTSAARQWAIDSMPDGINPDGGIYRVDVARAEEIVRSLNAEAFVVTEWKAA